MSELPDSTQLVFLLQRDGHNFDIDKMIGKFSLKNLLSGILILCVVLAAWRIFVYINRSYVCRNESYKLASRFEVIQMQLPSSASNISYYVRPDRLTLCARFRTTEKDFINWTESHGYSVVALTGFETYVDGLYNDATGSFGVLVLTSGFLYVDYFDAEEPHRGGKIAAYDKVSGYGYFSQW